MDLTFGYWQIYVVAWGSAFGKRCQHDGFVRFLYYCCDLHRVFDHRAHIVGSIQYRD
jgi:hypothetical protein